MNSIEANNSETHIDVDLTEQQTALAAERIAANLELLGEVATTAPIDHTALDQKTRKIAEIIIGTNSRV